LLHKILTFRGIPLTEETSLTVEVLTQFALTNNQSICVINTGLVVQSIRNALP